MPPPFNPYTGEDFFGFILLFLKRMFFFLTNTLKPSDLVSDEIQLLTLIAISISSALIGTFLVLRKMAMLANSISHTILVGIVIAYFATGLSFQESHESSNNSNLFILLFASLTMGIVTSFLTEFFTKTMKLQEDASIGLVFTTLFAIGITLVTLLTRSQHIGTELVTGNVDALHINDLKLSVLVLAINLGILILFYKEYLITSFDPFFASSLGFSVTAINYLIMTQASFTVTSAFRAVGVIMVLALMTGPVLAARLLTNELHRMLLTASFLGVLASIFGVAMARHALSIYSLALSTAGTTIFAVAILFIISACIFLFNESHFFKKNLKMRKSRIDSV